MGLWFCGLCPGAPESSTGSGSGFKASQKSGPRFIKVSSDRLGEPGIILGTPGYEASILFTTARWLTACNVLDKTRKLDSFRIDLQYALTLNAPIATKVVCFSRLLKCLRSRYYKHRNSLFWVHAVCFYT